MSVCRELCRLWSVRWSSVLVWRRLQRTLRGSQVDSECMQPCVVMLRLAFESLNCWHVVSHPVAMPCCHIKLPSKLPSRHDHNAVCCMQCWCASWQKLQRSFMLARLQRWHLTLLNLVNRSQTGWPRSSFAHC